MAGLTFAPRPGPDPLRELTADSATALVTWCKQHGLLGLLSHQSVMARRAPAWEPDPNRKSILVPTQIQFAPTGEGWTTCGQRRYGPKYGYPPNKLAWRGKPLPKDKFPGGWPGPGVLTQPLDKEIHRHEGFGPTWFRFFPGVPSDVVETHRYPAPLSKAFWRAHAEPVEDFVKAAVQLRKGPGFTRWRSRRRISGLGSGPKWYGHLACLDTHGPADTVT